MCLAYGCLRWNKYGGVIEDCSLGTLFFMPTCCRLTCCRELAKRNLGPGSFILDDERKYPQKESLGPLSTHQFLSLWMCPAENFQ